MLFRKEEILNELNPQQKEAVIDFVGPKIVVAAAGSGKTKMLVSRTAYMIESGISPKEILLFTFTRKAANEMKERIINYIGQEQGKDITVGTYHSFCMRQLRNYAHLLGYTEKFSIIDDDDRTLKIGRIMSQDPDMKGLEPSYIGSLISGFKELMLNPAAATMRAEERMDRLAARVYTVYQEELKRDNTMDFDDLIYNFVTILRNYSDVHEALNNRFKYIIADECQDSSPRDIELIGLLGGDAMNVCLVGDDYQSIYSFRGANLELLFNFVDINNFKMYRLERNYRSTQTIVNAAQSVVTKNPRQFEKTAYSENEIGNKIINYSVRTADDEALQVVKAIKGLSRMGYEYKDIAILYRTSAASRKIEETLLKNQIPYILYSGTPFYKRKEVKDILSVIRVLLNPRDSLALENCIDMFGDGLGKVSKEKILSCLSLKEDDIMTLQELISYVNASTVLTKKQRESMNAMFSILEQLSDIIETSTTTEFIDEVINQTNYLERLKKHDAANYIDREANINELSVIASNYISLDEFIENIMITVNSQADTEELENSNSVTMMTIHGSKGLEWRAVILVDAHEGVLPHFLAVKSGDISEERRLFYVAMTRAKEQLIITEPREVMTRAGMFKQKRSRFIDEIDKKYIVHN